MQFLYFINFIISLILIFFTIVIFRPINKYKHLKTKEDQLFLQKVLLSTIFFVIILVITILFMLNITESSNLFKLELCLFNCYIMAITLYNTFMAYELYSTFINPAHYFETLFKQKKYNYIPEFIILIISLIVFVLDIALYEEDEKYASNDSIVFIIIGKWKGFLVFILCILSLMLYFRINSKIQKFCFKNQEKLYDVISKRKMINMLYLIYGLFFTLPAFTSVKITEFYNIFGSIFFMIIICNEYIIHLSIIAPSKFCEYGLKNTCLFKFCSWFSKTTVNSGSSTPLVNESVVNEGTGMTTFQNETSTVLDIITHNPRDKELVSIFRNGIYIEDYYFHYFDRILNIITTSIYHVYNSNYFSSQANEQRLSSSIKIGADMSSIGGTMQSLTVSNLGNNNKTVINSSSELGDDTAKFDLKKNMEKDDFHRFQEVLENGIHISNNNNYLNVNIKSFFTPRCVESIYDQRLKGRNIANSLLSHMIITNNAKNRNLENPNSYYWSLLASNGKEQYFNKLKNTSLKTYDKNFTLDIFDTNDEEIGFNEKGKNNPLSVLIDQYFTYIHGKGIKGTFIPSLVGVFKIKINEFKTLLVFITRNSLVENIPKNFYTYWQMIRFLNDKPQKIASSQFSSGTLVKDDPIFERTFQIETKKDNPNYNKILVKNYIDFEETIQSDIEFLSRCGARNFDLLLMYYEYENTQKHDKQEKKGAIKIRKTSSGTEIIEESLPKGDFFDDVGSPINMDGKIPDTLGGEFLSMGGGFLDDNEFGVKSNKNAGNLFDVDEKVNISGYEGIFDSFNCLCFFTFENVFDIRKRLSLAINYYTSFQKKVLINFAEYKK